MSIFGDSDGVAGGEQVVGDLTRDGEIVAGESGVVRIARVFDKITRESDEAVNDIFGGDLVSGEKERVVDGRFGL